jgi:hypothetical protein
LDADAFFAIGLAFFAVPNMGLEAFFATGFGFGFGFALTTGFGLEEKSNIGFALAAFAAEPVSSFPFATTTFGRFVGPFRPRTAAFFGAGSFFPKKETIAVGCYGRRWREGERSQRSAIGSNRRIGRIIPRGD